MPLRDFLPFRGPENQQFINWPPAPPIRPIRATAEGALSALFNSKEQRDGEYPPVLIVAIGKTGEQTLNLLAEKISQSSALGSASVRALLLTESPSTLVSLTGRQIRAIELQQPPGTFSFPKGTTYSARSASNVLFQQVINYKRYQEWLQENLLDLGSDVQVFFVGSLAETTIGILGDALQILRNFSQTLGRSSLFSRVCVFLSLRTSATSVLPPDEIFAACREISRMTFAGPHRMNTSFGQSPIVESALLDYLFILEGSLPQTLAERQEINIAQLLADSLFSLLHPSARFLWENLINDLRLSGQIRRESHQPVVHSIGTATLYIPLNGIKRYISTRLAYAVLLGEQENVAEGLVKQSSSQPEQLRTLARQWLLNGPFPHSIFRWLLEANSANYFDTVPDLSPEFILLFQAQISHSLIRYINQIPADLGQARLALDWLDTHLSSCENWFKASKPTRPNAPERGNFQHALFKWRESIQSLSADLASWYKNLFPPAHSNIPATVPVSTSDWRNVKSTTHDWRELGDPKMETPTSIPAILKQWRAESEYLLSAASADRIYRSALSDADGGLKELETYYIDTVRPELSNLGREVSVSFTRIRQRLEWWIRLTPDRLPQLYLVCWPAAVTPSAEPPAEVCFKADQIQTFATALVQLALSQTESLEADLTTNWFGRRIKHLADFLRRAEDAYIRYDHNLAARFANAAAKRSYLITHDPLLSRNLVNDIFPDTPRFEINELDGGEKNRFTALSLRLNVPMGALIKLQEFQREYAEKLPENIHLYQQERTAAAYERRIWKLQRERILLSPELTVLLAEPQLVTLFFQALFTGVIHPEYDESEHEQHWVVDAVRDFSPLSLAQIGKDGLLLALRRFALEIPNASDINQNPQNHFHPSRRLNYISALIAFVKDLIFKPDARAVRQSLAGEFAAWRARGEQDDLALSFSAIIACELDEPVWTDW